MARPTSRKRWRSSSMAAAHATLKVGLGPRMSRRAPAWTARRVRAWLGAAAGSATIHVVALLALVRGPAPAEARGPWQMDPPHPSEWIDVVALDDPAPRPAS